ncbi:MAG: hypothetical protein AAGC96_21270 [Pseudomonadota bacterium]
MTRLIVFTSAFAIAAGAAMAGDSVLYLKSKPSESGSVITYTCDDCPELKPDFVAPNVHGVEVLEHEDEGGKKVVQHDNMMGGSAVRIVRTGNTQDNYAGQTVTRVPGGTVVTSGAPVVETVEPGQTPVVAGSNVTVSGGSDMNVEEVAEDGVDDGSQTSSVESVNMNAAQHDNAGPSEPEAEQPHNDGPEIIDLRD